MSHLKELINGRILVNCAIFAAVIGAVILWRVTYVQHTDIISEESGEMYLSIVLILFVVLRIILFLLYFLAKREEKRKPWE